MIILEDTRQQAKKHGYKHEYFLANGITVRRTTLSVGDYQLAGIGNCAVDTKKDMQELIGNIQFRAPRKSAIENGVAKVRDKYNIPVSQAVSLLKSSGMKMLTVTLKLKSHSMYIDMELMKVQ